MRRVSHLLIAVLLLGGAMGCRWFQSRAERAARRFVPPDYRRRAGWSDGETTVLLFALENRHNRHAYTIRLVVESEADLEVRCHTPHPSRVYETRELKPEGSDGKGIRWYDFRHGFSRRTIWMAVEIRKNGRRVDELTRTFYGDLTRVMPNDRFLAAPEAPEKTIEREAPSLKLLPEKFNRPNPDAE